MAEQQSSSSLLHSRTAVSPTSGAFWPPSSGDLGADLQTVPKLLSLGVGVGDVYFGEVQRNSLELASRDTASLASEEVAAVNIGADSVRCESSPLQLRCPTTPDDSSLQVEDDAPLCSSVRYLVISIFLINYSSNPLTLIAYYEHTSKKAKSGFRLPTSKKSKKFKQATPVREPIECFPSALLPPGQEGTQNSPFCHLVTPEVLALAESPVLVKSKKKKNKKKDKQGEVKTAKTKAKTKMKKTKDVEALPESTSSPGVKATEGLPVSIKTPAKSAKRGTKQAVKASDVPEPTSDTVYSRITFTVASLMKLFVQ
ncbi:unnamed protein product [Schistocephalus solidus]|uniref:MAP9 n=1 Tax=Schistocephalus solidus TaxID=70667 RepID=A0A183TR59_SCHSO|nr:unnamed protein product [Schistocephalus solidus]